MRLPAQLLDFHLQGFAGAALALKVLFDTRERKRETIRLRLHGGEFCVRPLQVLLRALQVCLLAGNAPLHRPQRCQLQWSIEECCCEIARRLVHSLRELGSLLLPQHIDTTTCELLLLQKFLKIRLYECPTPRGCLPKYQYHLPLS